MNIVFIIILIILVVVMLYYKSIEKFTEVIIKDPREIDIPTFSKKEKYIDFLYNFYNTFKNKSTCKVNINSRIKNETIKDFFQNKNSNCFYIANEICETIDPAIYTINNIYSIPKEYLITYKNQNIPTTRNLNCFNTVYKCCNESREL